MSKVAENNAAVDSNERNKTKRIRCSAEKSKWERERRDRLKDAFSNLEKLVMVATRYDNLKSLEKEKLTNIDILQKATTLIQQMQKQILEYKTLVKEPQEDVEKEIRMYLTVLREKFQYLKKRLRLIVGERRNKKKMVVGKNQTSVTLKKPAPVTNRSVKRARKTPEAKNTKNKENLKKPRKIINTMRAQLLSKNVSGAGFKNCTTTNQTLFLLRPDIVIPNPPPTILLLPPGTNQTCLPTSAPTATTMVNNVPIPAFSHTLSANMVMPTATKISQPFLPLRRVSHHTKLRIFRMLQNNNKQGKSKIKKNVIKNQSTEQIKTLDKNASSNNEKVSDVKPQEIAKDSSSVKNVIKDTCNNISNTNDVLNKEIKDNLDSEPIFPNTTTSTENYSQLNHISEKNNETPTQNKITNLEKIVGVHSENHNTSLNSHNGQSSKHNDMITAKKNPHLEKIVKDLQSSGVGNVSTNIEKNCNNEKEKLSVDQTKSHLKNIVNVLQSGEVNNVSSIETQATIAAETKRDMNSECDVPLSKKPKIIAIEDRPVNTIADVSSTNICEDVGTISNNNSEEVDAANNDIVGGRSRLELAEELLAASPTAAFLLTFPLVSAARPDTPDDARPQSEISNRTTVQSSILPSQTVQPMNTLTAHNNDGLEGLASFFSSKEPHYSKNVYPDHKNWTSDLPTLTIPPKSEFSSKILSCVMSDSFVNKSTSSTISDSYPLITSNSNNTFESRRHASDSVKTFHSFLEKNGSYKQQTPGSIMSTSEKSADKSSNNNTSANTSATNSYYDFSNQHYSQGKVIDRVHDVMKSTSSQIERNINSQDNYLQKLQSKETSARISCDNNNIYNNNYFSTSINNHSNSTYGVHAKTSNMYGDYNISNIYSQSVNMWNDEVTYHDLNSQNSINSKQGNATRNNYSAHYGNEPNNFYKTFIPPATVSSLIASDKSDMSQNCNLKSKPSNSNKHLVLDNKCSEERSTKKTAAKGPVNWMTSEARVPQSSMNSYTSNSINKDVKFDYTGNSYATPSVNSSDFVMNVNHDTLRKSDYQDNQFYSAPASNHGFQMNFEDCQQNWSAPKLHKSVELQLDTPTTLPTLLGDLALGTLERRRPQTHAVPPITMPSSTLVSNQEIFPPSTTFLSVSQLVENTSAVVPVSRSQCPVDPRKAKTVKNESVVKCEVSENKYQNVDTFPYYSVAPLSNISQPQVKNNSNSCNQQRQYKSKQQDLNKHCKSNYSAEALIRGVPQTNWSESTISKSSKPSVEMAKQYSDLTPLQDAQFSQMPHFTPVLDLGENLSLPQQYSSNSFSYGTPPTSVAPFYPSHSFVPSNYMGSGFLPDFMDFSNATTDSNNFSLPRLDPKTKDRKTTENTLSKNMIEPKSANLGYKQKVDHGMCKKDTNKKQNQKRPRGYVENSWASGTNDVNVAPATNCITSPLLTDDAFLNFFPTTGYQSTPTFSVTTSHIEPVIGMSAGHQSSCSLTSTMATAKTNFNLSTIFPEINKQQSTSTSYCSNVPGPNRHPQNKNTQYFHYRNHT